MFTIVAVLAKFLNYITIGLSSVFRPRLAMAIADGDTANTKRIIISWVYTLSLICAVFMLVIIFCGKWILSLYGTNYTEAYWALVVFSAGVSVYSILIVWRPVLQYIGREKQVMFIMAFSTIFAIVGMIVAGKNWAELGVSIVAGGAMAICAILLALFGRKALLFV
jgi:O-antigen/teichoic acid export membrane protein